MDVLLTVGAGLGGLAALLGILVVVARSFSRRGRAAVARRGGTPLREQTALSLGFASLGRTQVRGNVTLSLDDTRLVVAQWIPARTTEIPLDRVLAVDTARSHLGKVVSSRLLRIRFRRPDGTDDVIALQVRDLDGWLAALPG